MSTICQLDRYTAQVSELTGRTVYINDAEDRYLISPEWTASSVTKAVSAWKARVEKLPVEHRPTPGICEGVEALHRSATRTEFAACLETVLVTEYQDKLTSTSIKGKQRLLVELMLQLWSCGVVAWPAKEQVPFSGPVLALENQGFAEPQLGYLTKLRSYLNRGGTDDSANFRFILDHILSRTGQVEIGDLTPTTLSMSLERTRLGKLRTVAIQGLISVLRLDYHEETRAWTPNDFGVAKAKPSRLTRDDNFEWLTTKHPEMEHWARLGIEHLKENKTNFKKRRSSVHNFLKHYAEHPELPRNPAGYFDVRRRPTVLFDVPGNKGRQTMAVVHEFLNEVLFKVCAQTDDNEIPILMPGFANPLPKATYRGVNQGETHREAMPTHLINLATRILTENDFAWAKEAGGQYDKIRWLNPATGEFTTVWNPVRAYAILTKLLLPARGYQVRMLDSGEGDSARYEGEGKWAVNLSPHRPLAKVKSAKGEKPVERGVFRAYKRKDGSKGTVFYFNTNKSGDIDSDTKGYVMPWEKRDALQLLVELRNWQEMYNPVRGPTAWSDIVELQKSKHGDDLAQLGSNFFLFRDAANSARPDQPVTDIRVRSLWLKLMEEMERRLEKSGVKLDNGDPIKLILTRDKDGQPASAAFDLHSLRVSIITAMYEEGVPPEFLMKIVGHATVLMTLYYTKLNADTLTLRMDEALLARQRKAQTEMAGFVKRASRKELEKTVAFSHPSALDAAEQATGIGLLVMDHGICAVSAKRCNEGLAIIDLDTERTFYEAVPGGASNCVRCRFFMTGPAFLFGLEAHVNDLAYRLKKASYTFEKAQDKFDALSDAYTSAIEKEEPFHQQRAMEIAETAFEMATAEVDHVALSLQAAYALTEQCIRINTENTGDGLALVAVGGTGQVEAVLSEGHEFEQLNRICVNATFFDGLNINWQHPNLERARLFDRMLRNSGHEPRFSLLDDEHSLHVANAMSQFLYARLDANTVHSLVDGRTTLRAVGLEKAFVAQLDNMEPKTLSLAKNAHILEQA